MPGACAESWRPFACGWSIGPLWRWMDWIVRCDVILLGLMLGYVVVVAVHVSYRLWGRGRALTDGRERRQLAADLGVEVAVVRSIVVAAPYLGLVGACFGIMNAFSGIGMEKSRALALISSRVASSLVPSAIGTLVAVVATCASRHFSSLLEPLVNKCFAAEGSTRRYSRLAPKFPLKKRIPGPPAYALIATSILAGTVGAFMLFWSAYSVPRGFAVELETVQYEAGGRWMVLHVINGGEIFLNFEKQDWKTLPARLSEIYRVRADRTICLLVDDGVSYQRAMDAIDVVEGVPMPDDERIRVRLITPTAMGGCPVPVRSVRLK